MIELFSLLFLSVWVVGASALWVETVHDTPTALQFAFLTLPPTLVLLFSLLFGRKLAR